MKLLILSDSHRNIDRMSIAVGQALPDVILHLGDHIADAEKLRLQFPGMMFFMVKGNCDVSAAGNMEKTVILEGVKIFMAHGHTYNVKNGLTAFSYRASEAGADIALYGHTHKAGILRADGIWLMNPGQLERNDSIRPASFGVVTLENGKIDMKIENLPL